MQMKLLPTILMIQFCGLARAQSSCENDLDTFEDGTGQNGEHGKGCSFYRGKDCLAEATSRGVTSLKKRELLWSCKHACGLCGKDTIVKECKDSSCECKDTPNFEMTTMFGKKLRCDHLNIGSCIYRVTTESLTDKQVREYMTNCAASCQICSPCSNVGSVGDGICDPGNNNEKCYRVEKDGQKSARYDGGDCCNQNEDPFFDQDSANSQRYTVCAKSTSSYDKQFCKCLAPSPARTNDCAGGFSDFGECSVTCGGYGVRKRKFIVLHPAKAGGQPCEFKDGETQEKRCGRPSKECPSTTPTTTASTASTASTTTPSKSTTTSKSKSTTTTKKGGASSKSPDKPVTDDTDDDDDDDDDGEQKKKVVDEVDLTTVSTMMATVICLIYSLV